MIRTEEGAETGLDFAAIEREVAQFERAERQRLGLVEATPNHWSDPNPQRFTRDRRGTTTVIFGGLTPAQDLLIGGACRGLGYQVISLETPDVEALRYGREFCNRGQCNPTYFTVGNLLKFLSQLRDTQGLSTCEIVDRYLFLTASSCGPCRFGTYATEFRKALRDAGFAGFRVLLCEQQGGLTQGCGEDAGLELSPRFFIAALKALIAGDVINAMGYRLRPYETQPGTTDAALEKCKALLHDALAARRSPLWALWRCRSLLRQVRVDRSAPKPKVSLIGEFFAMTTEGDGNHRLQRFLEQEGAEVEVQAVTSWLLYTIWEVRWDTRRRLPLRGVDSASQGLAGANPRRRLRRLAMAELALRTVFGLYARLVGLRHFHLSDMEVLAQIADPYYDNYLRGGEGHLEVGKLIQSVRERKHHMVVSVKPFGCMPSSGVSDGVQSLVTEHYPDAIFCAVETTGDGAANVQSRIQMDLYKARQRAIAEFESVAGEAAGGQARSWLRRPLRRRRLQRALYDPLWYPSVTGLAGTAARGARQIR
jgi:predicted nucleotide-binding protein (sugar kinase/HSP70/actin superfamily)